MTTDTMSVCHCKIPILSRQVAYVMFFKIHGLKVLYRTKNLKSGLILGSCSKELYLMSGSSSSCSSSSIFVDEHDNLITGVPIN